MLATPSHLKNVVEVTRLIRRNFQLLRSIGDALHENVGINASTRAILEWLAENGMQTVPRIADAKSVSRQHVQIIADELAVRGLVEFVVNPAHKRSPFLRLTPDAKQLFTKMKQREIEPFSRLATRTDPALANGALEFLLNLESELKEILGAYRHDDNN